MNKSELMFTRGNGKRVKYPEAISVIGEFIRENLDSSYDITVGTDSQNADHTKMVEVIAVHRVGEGGLYFYRIEHLPKITSLKQKITTETARSLELADGLVDDLALYLLEHDIDIDDLAVSFKIHCDIGNYGKTKALITEIVSWVTSSGYSCEIKPDSYCASGIANKYSKF